MCCRSRNRRACLVLLCLLHCACSGDRRVAGKIAILPFENLTSDPALDWVSRALAEVLRAQLTGGSDVDPVVVPVLREVPASGAAGILQGYFSIDGGRLRVQAVLENAPTNRTMLTASTAGPPGRVLPLAASLAWQLDPRVRPFSTGSEAALRAYVEALGAADPAPAFTRAIAADPGFGTAYVAWAEWLISRGVRAQAREVVSAGQGKGTRIPPVERARLGYLAAVLQGDRVAERRALVDLARTTPADASVYRMLANLDLAARAYPAAVQWYNKALEREPDNVALLNEAGYANAYARNLEAATQRLSRYRDLRPLEANPLDSLGDVHFYLGRFSQAENYYLEGYAKDTSFLFGGELYKAAWARLMTGDLKGADEAFGRFLQARQGLNDPLAPYRQAQWEYLTGRRKQAIARLDRMAQAPQPPLASLAAFQLSVWMLETGSPTRAFEAGPSQYAQACQLLLSKQFPEAATRVTKLYQQTSPASPDPLDVLLAWALLETDRFNQAAELLATNPIPDPLREHPFLSLSFPRIFFLRGVVLEKQGRREEAKINYGLFLRYSGDLPMTLGEEQRAREALARL